MEETSPFYLYDREEIRRQCRRFLSIPYPLKSVHFATMANISPGFLEVVREMGLSVFVNSLVHLREVMAQGFGPRQIVFTASAMDELSMRYVREVGIQVNLDSLNQVRAWKRLFGDAPFGIRCNIGTMVSARVTHAGFFIGKESRLGLDEREIRSLAGDPALRGLHVYVGTDITDLGYFLACYRTLGNLAHLFPNLEYLNFGGGFGLKEGGEEDFSLEKYGEEVSRLMEEISAGYGRPLRMILEPGRVIGGSAGFFVCRVTDVKEREDRTFAGVNASSVQFPRPLFYPDTARHPVCILREGLCIPAEEARKTSIYGCSTYSRDILLRDAMLPRMEIGDLVVFGQAGSYCAASYTNFLGFPQPKEYYI